MPPFDLPPGDVDLERECEAILSTSRYFDITVGGATLKARIPHPAAVHAFTAALSRYTPKTTRVNMMSKFIQDHLAPESLESFLEMAMDPDTTMSNDDYFRVFQRIATSGTGRPSGPSRY